VFEVVPNCLDFKAIESNTVYRFKCLVRNLGSRGLRFQIDNPAPPVPIRYDAPDDGTTAGQTASSAYCKVYYKKGPVAAGKGIQLTVELVVASTGPFETCVPIRWSVGNERSWQHRALEITVTGSAYAKRAFASIPGDKLSRSGRVERVGIPKITKFPPIGNTHEDSRRDSTSQSTQAGQSISTAGLEFPQ
jgi:hypothetical protein